MPEQSQEELNIKLIQCISACEEKTTIRKYCNDISTLCDLLIEEEKLGASRESPLSKKAKSILLNQRARINRLVSFIMEKQFLLTKDKEEIEKLSGQTLAKTIETLIKIKDSASIQALIDMADEGKIIKLGDILHCAKKYITNENAKNQILEKIAKKIISSKGVEAANNYCLAYENHPDSIEVPILKKLLAENLEKKLSAQNATKHKTESKVVDNATILINSDWEKIAKESNKALFMKDPSQAIFDSGLPAIISLMNELNDTNIGADEVRKKIIEAVIANKTLAPIVNTIKDYLNGNVTKRKALYDLDYINKELKKFSTGTLENLFPLLTELSSTLLQIEGEVKVEDEVLARWIDKQKNDASKNLTEYTYQVASNLNQIAKNLSKPDSTYITNKLKENKDDHLDFAGGESFALRRVGLEGNVEKDRTRIIENLHAQKKALIHIIHTTTASLSTAGSSLANEAIKGVIRISGPILSYEVCLNHPDSISRTLFARAILTSGLEKLHQEEINHLVDILAQKNPEEVYSYFLNPQGLKDTNNNIKSIKGRLGMAILNSRKMSHWLLNQSPDKFYPLFDRIRLAIFSPESKNSDESIKNIFSKWDKNDFAKAIHSIVEAKQDQPGVTDHCTPWLHWAKLTNATVVDELKDSEIKTSLDAINILKLSPNKIKLLSKKSRKFFLENLDDWNDEREKFSKEVTNALVHDFTTDDFTWIPPTGLLFLFEKFPHEIIDYITKKQSDPAYKKLARILLRELDSGCFKEEKHTHAKIKEYQSSVSFWQAFTSNRDGSRTFRRDRINALVRAGFYQLEEKDDMQSDMEGLLRNQLLINDIKDHWDDFLKDANPRSIIFFFTSNLIKEINPEQVDSLLKNAIQKIKAEGLLAIIKKYETANPQIARTLLGRLPDFIRHYKNFDYEDIEAFKILIDKAKAKPYQFDFATQSYSDKDKSLSTATHPLLKALNDNKSENKWGLIGVIYASDPKLLSYFLSQASDHPLSQWSRFLKRVMPSSRAVKWTLAWTSIGGISGGILHFLNPPDWMKSSSVWKKLNQWGGMSTGVVSGYLASSFLASALGGLGATTAGVVFAVSASVVIGLAAGLLFGLLTYGIGNGLWNLIDAGYRFVTGKLKPEEEQRAIMVNILKHGNAAVVTNIIFNNPKVKENYEKMRNKIDDMGTVITDISPDMKKMDNAIMAVSRIDNELFLIKYARKLAGTFLAWSGSFPWTYMKPQTIAGYTIPWGIYRDEKMLVKASAEEKSHETSLLTAEARGLSPSISVYAALQGSNPSVPLSPKVASSTSSMDTLTATRLTSTTEESKRPFQTEETKIIAQTSRLVREKNAEPRSPVIPPKTPSPKPPGTKKSSLK